MRIFSSSIWKAHQIELQFTYVTGHIRSTSRVWSPGKYSPSLKKRIAQNGGWIIHTSGSVLSLLTSFSWRLWAHLWDPSLISSSIWVPYVILVCCRRQNSGCASIPHCTPYKWPVQATSAWRWSDHLILKNHRLIQKFTALAQLTDSGSSLSIVRSLLCYIFDHSMSRSVFSIQ